MTGRAGTPGMPLGGIFNRMFQGAEPEPEAWLRQPFAPGEFDPQMHAPMFPSEDAHAIAALERLRATPPALTMDQFEIAPWPILPSELQKTRSDLLHATGSGYRIRVGTSGSFADKKYRDERPCVGYCKLPSVQDAPLLASAPAFAPVTNIPTGGVVALLKLEWGADGNAFDLRMTQLPGQISKVPLVGARLRLSGAFAPKFYAPDDVTFLNTRIYLTPGLGPGAANQLSNDRYSRPQVNDVLVVGGAQLAALGLSDAEVFFEGVIGEGTNSVDTLSKISRRWYASARPSVAATQTVCPIPEGTTTVMLLAPPGFTFTMRPEVPAIQFAGYGVPFSEVGPFPPGVSVPLIDDAVDVIVQAPAGLLVETQFEIVFFISV